jgi:hypothetical protein
MASIPKISVVMPACNAAAYVDQAVKSVLGQSFEDFEFIIVDDGSSDETGAILERHQRLDRRVQVHHRERQGLAAALNYGCQRACGPYIARMDADDISFPHRLERQIEYIEKHPEIGIVGSWICKIDEHGSARGTWCPPTDPKMLQWTHFFGVCVSHPTVLMRREVLQRLGFYKLDAVYVVDVDLWLRASLITEFGNVPEILLSYRVWPGSMSNALAQPKREAHVRRLAAFISGLLDIDAPLEAVAGLRRARVGPPFETLEQIHLTAGLIQKLHENFVQQNNLTPQQRKEISWDAARKTAFLALQASRFAMPSAATLLMQALRIDYRLINPATMIKGLRRGLREGPAVPAAGHS